MRGLQCIYHLFLSTAYRYIIEYIQEWTPHHFDLVFSSSKELSRVGQLRRSIFLGRFLQFPVSTYGSSCVANTAMGKYLYSVSIRQSNSVGGEGDGQNLRDTFNFPSSKSRTANKDIINLKP